MAEPNLIFETAFRINSFECDINRRWKPAAFFQHLTEAAGRHADLLGCGFETMFAQNLYWVHARMKIKFLRFPQDGEQITIATWPKTIQQKLFFIRDYEIHAVDGSLLAAASSAWLVIDATSRRMVPPQTTNLNLPCLPEKTGLDEPLERLVVPGGGEEQIKIMAGYSAVDMLEHVNNSRYVEWICDVFPLETHRQNNLEWMQINYEKEVRPGDEVSVCQHRLDGDSTLWAISGQNRTTGTRAFEARGKWSEST
jgi:medium-chain acyl-[acyl-carrier-protein] hydrolase